MRPLPVYIAPGPHWTAQETFKGFAAERGREIVDQPDDLGAWSLVDGVKKYRVTVVRQGTQWVFAVYEDGPYFDV